MFNSGAKVRQHFRNRREIIGITLVNRILFTVYGLEFSV